MFSVYGLKGFVASYSLTSQNTIILHRERERERTSSVRVSHLANLVNTPPVLFQMVSVLLTITATKLPRHSFPPSGFLFSLFIQVVVFISVKGEVIFL